MAFADDKTCVLDQVTEVNCDQKAQLEADWTDYDGTLALLFANSNLFCCSPGYMRKLVACLDESEMESRGIYIGQTGTTVTNPLILIDCTYDEVIYDEGPIDEGDPVEPYYDGDDLIIPPEPYKIQEVAILGNSVIKKVSVTLGTTINVMTIGGNAVVGVIDAQAAEPVGGSSDILANQIAYLRLVTCNGNNGTVLMATEGTDINNIRRDEGSVFGGYRCNEFTEVCADAINDYDTRNETQNSIALTWVAPTNSQYVEISFRSVGEKDWKRIVMGDYNDNYFKAQERGDKVERYAYLFRDLLPDTYYEFQLVNYCIDGQPSKPAIIKTVTLPNNRLISTNA